MRYLIQIIFLIGLRPDFAITNASPRATEEDSKREKKKRRKKSKAGKMGYYRFHDAP